MPTQRHFLVVTQTDGSLILNLIVLQSKNRLNGYQVHVCVCERGHGQRMDRETEKEEKEGENMTGL